MSHSAPSTSPTPITPPKTLQAAPPPAPPPPPAARAATQAIKANAPGKGRSPNTSSGSTAGVPKALQVPTNDQTGNLTLLGGSA